MRVERLISAGAAEGCPKDQLRNFRQAGIVLQPRQLAASAAARLCDRPSGPVAVGFGGARGGGKSHWLLAQVGADDCQRVPELKVLLLRKVGKANVEHFEDLRRRLFNKLPHEFSAMRGVLTFENGSRIIAGHFQNEKDIDAYLGLEYDAIAIEEATTLSARKYSDISTCCRTSKDGWRPRIYSTTNPGGIGHAWYKAKFVSPHAELRETDTRFIPSRVGDNSFNNPEYRRVLEGLLGWQKRAWLEGDWDIAAGQFFTTFRREIHVVSDPPAGRAGSPSRPLGSAGTTPPTLNCPPTLNYFDETRAVEWWAALDYGFTHFTVVLLGCTDSDGNTFVVDEHAQRLWIPQRHSVAIKAMLARHNVLLPSCAPAHADGLSTLNPQLSTARILARFVAGTDVFSRQSDGVTIAQLYAKEGIRLTPANMDRLNGWAEILQRLGDDEAGVPPRLFIHRRCGRLAETLPALQHDPNRPEDVLKVDADEEGNGGDDAADALRYLISTKPRTLHVGKLRGL